MQNLPRYRSGFFAALGAVQFVHAVGNDAQILFIPVFFQFLRDKSGGAVNVFGIGVKMLMEKFIDAAVDERALLQAEMTTYVFGLHVESRGNGDPVFAAHFDRHVPEKKRHQDMHHVAVLDRFADHILVGFGKFHAVFRYVRIENSEIDLGYPNEPLPVLFGRGNHAHGVPALF